MPQFPIKTLLPSPETFQDEEVEQLFDYLVEIGEEQLNFLNDVDSHSDLKELIFSLNYCGIHLVPTLDPINGWNAAAFIELKGLSGYIGINKKYGLYFKEGNKFYRVKRFSHVKNALEIEHLGSFQL